MIDFVNTIPCIVIDEKDANDVAHQALNTFFECRVGIGSASVTTSIHLTGTDETSKGDGVRSNYHLEVVE